MKNQLHDSLIENIQNYQTQFLWYPKISPVRDEVWIKVINPVKALTANNIRIKSQINDQLDFLNGK